MSIRQIHKLSFPISALNTLPKDQLSAFLLLGLFLNEANWLKNLLLVSTLDQGGNEAEKNGRLVLSMMLSKVLAAKIYEGWCRMLNNPMKATLDALPPTSLAKQLHQELAPLLAKGSLIHLVRNYHASHYPTQLSLNGLPGIAQDDLAIYATQFSGNTISLVSDLAATAEMIDITGKSTIGEALKAILDEVVKATGIYCEILHEQIWSLLDVIETPVTKELINNDDAPALDSIRLRFFASLPENS